MSFAGEVKEELAGRIGSARHCQIAGFAAIFFSLGHVERDAAGAPVLYLQSDNAAAARKCFTILRKAFNIKTGFLEGVSERQIRGRSCRPFLNDPQAVGEVLAAIRLQSAPDAAGGKNLRREGRARGRDTLLKEELLTRSAEEAGAMITRNSCCKRAFLRDSFLCIGSMSDPRGAYHLEFVCAGAVQAAFLQSLLADFDLHGRIVRRKRSHVVYLKEGAEIVDLLNVMEAHVALMKLENLRIYKDMRNTVNRRVNCETANIAKTVNAASKQREDILELQRRGVLGTLPEELRLTAEARLAWPEATLQELGERLEPPVGKSGVNHRLRKLGALAAQIRGEEKEAKSTKKRE